MVPSNHTLDLAQLCDAADVTPRTVRYYIQQGLLPAPESRGPGAHYDDGHLARLRLIRRLQSEHLPLGEIRQRLERLTDSQVADLLSAADMIKRDPGALSYIRSVLSGEGPRAVSAAAVRLSESRPSFHDDPTPLATRSTWERIALTRDVELHVRRPLTRDQSKIVDRLLALARELSTEEFR
ncbi:MAG: MerR family transcriptional regulator [Gemmatimonadaceae bacterium]